MVREYLPQNKGKDLWSDHPISCLDSSSVSVVGGQFCCSTLQYIQSTAQGQTDLCLTTFSVPVVDEHLLCLHCSSTAYLASAGRAVFKAMQKGDPDAIW